MRIVQFIDNLDSGGKERQLVELLKGLNQMSEVECELIVMSENIHYTDLLQLNVPVHSILRRTPKDLRVFLQLYRLLKRIKPDILHSWSSMCSVYALPTVKMQNINFVNGFLRNVPPSVSFGDEEWIRSKITFPFSDAIVANSQAGLVAYSAPPEKSYCIYNGFDFNRLNHLENREKIKGEYDISTDFVVGMVGSFSDNKDFPTFIEAAQSILEKRNDVTFLAIGEGENRKQCMDAVSVINKRKIKFLGRLKDVESLIQILNIGVLCSNAIVHGEGISNSIMEYMALGKPVVATDCGGNRELTIDGETGFLVNNGSAEELTEKLLQLIENPIKAKKFGASAKQRLESNFSLNRMTDDYLELYRKIIS